MAMTMLYNGVQFAPVNCRMSTVVPHNADVLWSVVGKFGKQAHWMGTVEGQPIYTQLLGGETADYIGAVRVFGIADKMLFEQLTRLDNHEMVMCWQLTTHPMNSNPFPAAFVNCKASLQVTPITFPGGSSLIDWRIDLLTEQHHVGHMTKAVNDIMIVGLTNLIKYMEQDISSSGGSSVGRRTGLVGSLLAPSVYGIQAMPQPSPAQMHMFHTPDMHPGVLTGGSLFLQQPTFVPAPQERIAGLSAAQYQQQHIPAHVYQQFPQQQPQQPQFAAQQQHLSQQQEPQFAHQKQPAQQLDQTQAAQQGQQAWDLRQETPQHEQQAQQEHGGGQAGETS